MLFNSVPYIFAFLPAVVLVYFLLNGRHCVEAAKWWLAFASLVFYSWWNVSNLPILIVSILANWAAALGMWRCGPARPALVRRIFVAGLVFNLLYLGCFKYYDFIARSLNESWPLALPLLNVALPLGISFFTLTQIAYLVDVKEGLVPRQRFQNYALFVLFFPHLIIGPILHHKDMMPQFASLRTKVFSLENLATGMLLFAIGFAKKALIADPLSPYVRFHFDEAGALGMVEAWQAAIAFTFQLYFDFSGYVDMALGSALMLNIRMPENFNSPLRARSVIEFWSRWHMTLTNFLTTYIYTPILYAFRKLTFRKSLVAVFVTFFISGIWHGAAWTFVLFGAAHGTALAINHAWRRNRLPMPAALGWLLTFVFVTCTMVLFRAQDTGVALKVFEGMLGMNGTAALNHWDGASGLAQRLGRHTVAGLDLEALALVAAAAFVVFTFKPSGELAARFRNYLGDTRAA